MRAAFRLLCCLPLAASSAAARADRPPYLDPALPTEARVADLLSRLSPEEKIAQLGHEAPGIARLGIDPYNWSNECLHGVASPGFSTVFPQAIGLAAAWDVPLHQGVASAIGDEARGHYHQYVREGNFGLHTGLTCWSPNINIFRDPRWGRGQETYGEDPYLTGQLGAAFVRGLQGDDPRYLKAIATPKHYAVHSGPESQRHTIDVHPENYDLADTYLPAFEASVRGAGAQSVMCAYNRLDGQPACASDLLLKTLLRGAWKFPGYVVSDCGAITDIYATHQVVPTLVDAAALALNAGTDLACGDEYKALGDAQAQGLVAQATIDQSVGRLFTQRMKLGMFDPPEMVPYAQIPFAVVDSPANSDLSYAAARESIVLLKNANQALPLPKTLKSLAVIGPNGDRVPALLGNYNATPSHPVTLVDGLKRKLGAGAQVTFAQGSPLVTGFATNIPSATAAVLFHRGADGQLSPGLDAAYYAGMELAGPPLLERVDANVDFDWSNAAPAREVPLTGFSARWTGVIVPEESGDFILGVSGDDGYRLYVDGRLVVDRWVDQPATARTTTVALERGKASDLRLEYYQNLGGASVHLLYARPENDLLAHAVETAKAADYVVLALGISPEIEGEDMPVHLDGFDGGDRTRIDLPDAQEQLLRTIVALGRPTVLVLMNGSALAVNWAADHVPAIVEAWYPGQRGGDAIADVLFGDYNPAGRLPVTFYRSLDQIPPFTSYGMTGRTYRYFQGEPLFPFGFGLSYAQFRYGAAALSKTTIGPTETVDIGADVQNTSSVAGDEVVQVYVSHDDSAVRAPIRALRAFRRIHLAAGEKRHVQFTLGPDDFALANDTLEKKVVAGRLHVAIGGKQPGFSGQSDAQTTESALTALTIEAPAH